MKTKEYNGYKNYETWNIALWVNNTEDLYRSAVRHMLSDHRKTDYDPYLQWINSIDLNDAKTPDGVSFTDSNLDYHRLNELMKEFLQ